MGTVSISQLDELPDLDGTELVEVSKLSDVVIITAATISADGDDNSYNDSANGFVAAGFVVGMRVNVAGFTGNVANNIVVGIITALTAAKMTIGGADGNVIVDDAAGESVTIAKWESYRTSIGEIAGAASVTFATGAEYIEGSSSTKVLSPDTVWDAADPVALNDSGGNIAVDLDTGINFTMTMDGDYTLSAPTNGKPGQTGCIEFTQDGTGNQTLAYDAAWKFAGGTDPVLSTAAGARDLLFYQVLDNGDVFANLVKAIA